MSRGAFYLVVGAGTWARPVGSWYVVAVMERTRVAVRIGQSSLPHGRAGKVSETLGSYS